MYRPQGWSRAPSWPVAFQEHGATTSDVAQNWLLYVAYSYASPAGFVYHLYIWSMGLGTIIISSAV